MQHQAVNSGDCHFMPPNNDQPAGEIPAVFALPWGSEYCRSFNNELSRRSVSETEKVSCLTGWSAIEVSSHKELVVHRETVLIERAQQIARRGMQAEKALARPSLSFVWTGD